MAETLRFETNVPVVMSLCFDTGKDVEGRYGDQVMYSVKTELGDRVMYVPPQVRGHIEQAGIRAGDLFRIGKFEVKNGNRKHIEWKVELVQPEDEMFLDDAPRAPDFPRSNPPVQNNQPKGMVPPPSSPAPAPPPPTSAIGKVNGSSALPQTPVPFAARGDSQYILSALVNMIDICSAAEQFAKAKGMDLHFTSEDVRALTITCYIQQTRNGNGYGGAR